MSAKFRIGVLLIGSAMTAIGTTASAQQGTSATEVEAAGVSLRSVAVEFPLSDAAFPAGDGAELVTANCTACHSPGMILTQPKLSPATWTGEVQKMQRTYKAPVDEADVPAIVAYLVTLPRSP